MPADITQDTRVAVNWSRGHPWHQLGKRVEKDMTIDEGLELVGIENEEIKLVKLYEKVLAQHPDFGENAPYIETFKEIPIELFGVKSSEFGIMASAGNKFVPPQRRDVLERAFEITGIEEGAAVIDTIGLLGDRGETFFAYIRQPEMVIDPNGIADVIERGLFTANAWDGTMSRVTGYSAIRVVCRNTLNMALGGIQQLIKVRNTRNAEDRIRQAAVSLQYSGAVEAEMTKRAEKMLAVPGDKAFQEIVDHFWDVKDPELNDKAKSQRNRKRESVRRLYEDKEGTNAAMVGDNGWAAWNAFVEFQDHERDVAGKGGDKALIRARTAVLPGAVRDAKIEASNLVLALAA